MDSPLPEPLISLVNQLLEASQLTTSQLPTEKFQLGFTQVIHYLATSVLKNQLSTHSIDGKLRRACFSLANSLSQRPDGFSSGGGGATSTSLLDFAVTFQGTTPKALSSLYQNILEKKPNLLDDLEKSIIPCILDALKDHSVNNELEILRLSQVVRSLTCSTPLISLRLVKKYPLLVRIRDCYGALSNNNTNSRSTILVETKINLLETVQTCLEVVVNQKPKDEDATNAIALFLASSLSNISPPPSQENHHHHHHQSTTLVDLGLWGDLEFYYNLSSLIDHLSSITNTEIVTPSVIKNLKLLIDNNNGSIIKNGLEIISIEKKKKKEVVVVSDSTQQQFKEPPHVAAVKTIDGTEAQLDTRVAEILSVLPQTSASKIRQFIISQAQDGHGQQQRSNEEIIDALLNEEMDSDNQVITAAAGGGGGSSSGAGAGGRAAFDDFDPTKFRKGKRDDEPILGSSSTRDFLTKDMKALIISRAEAPSSDEGDDDDDDDDSYVGVGGGSDVQGDKGKGKGKGKKKVETRGFIEEFSEDDDGGILRSPINDMGSLRRLGIREGGESSGGEDDDDDDDDEGNEGDESVEDDESNAEEDDKQPTKSLTPEEILEQIYISSSNRSIFERDSQTRRSKEREELRKRIGWSDEQIEGWKIMLERDSKRLKRVFEKHEFGGNVKGGVVNVGKGKGKGKKKEVKGGGGGHHANGGDGEGGGGGGSGRGRGRGRGGGRGERGGRGRGGRAAHDRRTRGRDRKMAKAGGPS